MMGEVLELNFDAIRSYFLKVYAAIAFEVFSSAVRKPILINIFSF